MKTATVAMVVVTFALTSVVWFALIRGIYSVDVKNDVKVIQRPAIEKVGRPQESDDIRSVENSQQTDNNRERAAADTRADNMARAASQPLTTDELLEYLVLQADGDPPGGLHSRLLSEDRDSIWAPATEGRIQSELAILSEQTGDWVDVPYVECRATLCEIRAVGDAHESHEMPAWQDKLLGTDWVRQQFPNVESRMSLLLDGRAGYVTFLVRDKNQVIE